MYDSKHPQFHSLGHAIGAHHRGLLLVRLSAAYFDLRFARRCLRLETDRMLAKLESGASIEAEMTERIHAYETARAVWREAYQLLAAAFGAKVARDVFEELKQGVDDTEPDQIPEEP